MRRVVDDFDIEHRGQTAEALCADAERIHTLIDFEAQLLDLGPRPARDQVRDVDRTHQ